MTFPFARNNQNFSTENHAFCAGFFPFEFNRNAANLAHEYMIALGGWKEQALLAAAIPDLENNQSSPAYIIRSDRQPSLFDPIRDELGLGSANTF